MAFYYHVIDVSSEVINDLLLKIQSLKQDLMNLSMEARLSVELEMNSYKEMHSKLSLTIQSLTDKFRQLNTLYLQECEKRRQVRVKSTCDGNE